MRASGHPTIRGNYDDGVGFRKGQCGCYYGTEQAKADGAASYTFTDAALDDDEHAYLRSLARRYPTQLTAMCACCSATAARGASTST